MFLKKIYSIALNLTILDFHLLETAEYSSAVVTLPVPLQVGIKFNDALDYLPTCPSGFTSSTKVTQDTGRIPPMTEAPMTCRSQKLKAQGTQIHDDSASRIFPKSRFQRWYPYIETRFRCGAFNGGAQGPFFQRKLRVLKRLNACLLD